ncbi:MAG: T9SS type A sorting domain-containing protein [Bacteroidales bacterium]
MKTPLLQSAVYQILTLSFIGLFPLFLTAQETEPNNSPAQANLFPVNSSLTAAINAVGDEDWFALTLPEEGTLKVRSTGVDINDYYITLYDSNGTSVLSTKEVYPLGETDSVFKTNLQASTYFLRVHPYSANVGSYNLTSVFIPALLPNDPEPNNSVDEATFFPLNSQTTGRLNYVLEGVGDTQDWFSITTTEEGKLSIISTSPDNNDYYMILVDVDGTEILSSCEVYPLGEVDSVYKTNLQAGTYYLKVYPYSANHGSYHLENRFTPALLPNDPEPNNQSAQASDFPLFTTITGRLNYVYDNVADNSDWFTVTTPDDGVLTLISHSPDNNDYYIRLFDVDAARQLMQKEVYPLGEIDSVYKANLQAGTYFIQVVPYSSYHGSYYLESKFSPALLPSDPEPNNTAETASPFPVDTLITGRINYLYDNVADNQDWFAITMPQNGGLKVTSHSLDDNDYYFRLVDADGSTILALSNVYQFATRTLFAWSLEAGETYYINVYPYSSNFGSYYLDIELQPAPVAGFHFNPDFMEVLFTNESRYATSYLWDFGDGTTSDKVHPSHQYTGPGAFEVTLTAENPNGYSEFTSFVEFRGIQKVEGQRGGNTGAVTVTVFAGGLSAQSVPLLRRGTTEITGSAIVFPTTGQIQAIFDLQGADTGTYHVVIQHPGEPEMILPDAYTVEEGTAPEVYVNVNGRGRALINRWATYSVDIGNSGNTDAFYRILWLAVPDSVKFKNVLFDLDVYNDPEAAAYLADCPPYWEIDTLGTQPFNGRLYGIPLHKIPADSRISIEMKVKAVENFRIVAFTTTPWFTPEDFTETMSYNECVAWAIATMIRDKLIEQLTGLVPGADCIYGSVKSLSEVTLSYTEGKLSVGSMAWTISQVVWTCLKDLGQNIPFVKALKISKVMIDLTVDVVNCYNSDQECQQYKMKQVKEQRVAAVTSLDPNEIAGPAGFTDQHYIAGELMDYTVFFENKNTAAANAVEVFIYDTLAIGKYDPASFRFGEVAVSGFTYPVFADGNTFTSDFDLRPNLNCIVRVDGSFNPENGAVYWHFMSLDPETMDITEDPEAGFLPPNIESPEGEGSVMYHINLKAPLTHQNSVAAKATIVFDFNAPLVTNTYMNTIDLEAPVSSVYAVQLAGENLYELFWQGEDSESGVHYYNIYWAEGSGDYSLWRNNTERLSDTLRIAPGVSYKFFAQAVDYLGNEEPYKGYAEQVLGTQTFGTQKVHFSLVPNPASRRTSLRLNLPAPDEVTVRLFAMDGRMLFTSGTLPGERGTFQLDLNLTAFRPGIYNVSVQTSFGTGTHKLIIE